MKIAKLKTENYLLTVGLEIHAELNTQTKMFCDSKNDTDLSAMPAHAGQAGEKYPNINICPVCMGYPGTLPVINKEAVRSVLRLGVAVGGEIADFTEFDRKNYFYPDIPKGYQISQYKYPLVKGGMLCNVALTRIHLEEDTAKSTHNSQLTTDNYSLLDFNRAGVPLAELVTEPVIHDAKTAARFAREFQLLLTYLNIAHANMEKGEMRVEANISISKKGFFGGGKLGTKVEVKNLNSFKSVEKAIEYEFERQTELLESGGKITQETRGWDEEKEETFSQRAKEESHDYRYFPDPDLPSLFIKDIPEFSEMTLKESLPELPWQKREKYTKDFGLKNEDIEIYVREPEWGKLIEGVAKILKPARPSSEGGDKELIQLASNYITSDLKIPISVEALIEVIKMLSAGEISSRGAKDILEILQKKGGEPRGLAEEKNLIQKSDVKELRAVAEKVLQENEKAATEYRNGKTSSLQFLIGEGMKVTKGSANPQVLKEIFENLLS